MKAAGHVLPARLRPGRALPLPTPLPLYFLSLSGNVSRPGGYVYPGGGEEVAGLDLGQRAPRGVLLDLAACPLVTQARWSSPTHNTHLELRAPEAVFS